MGLFLGCAWAQAPTPAPEAEVPAPAHPSPSASTYNQTSQSICLIIESAAWANHLPLEFFARVIWQESRFQSNAVGPRTRSGERAQGIAQFMPRTASERGLLDPFDPVQALPKSAEFLNELRMEFGNLGLAAAAYNAGPRRVRDFLAGRGGLPAETRNYVAAITGNSVDDWASIGRREPEPKPAPTCRDLASLLKEEPNVFVQQLEQRVALVAALPWGVQLSAGFSRELALKTYARTAARLGSLLEGHDPSILASRLLSRGPRTFYQVRIGTNTRSGAEQLCTKIKRAGDACIVLHNHS
jgi:hypothetical protein